MTSGSPCHNIHQNVYFRLIRNTHPVASMDADHFSVANIPFGIGTSRKHPKKSVVTRLENKVIFLQELCKAGLLPTLSKTTVKTFSEV